MQPDGSLLCEQESSLPTPTMLSENPLEYGANIQVHPYTTSKCSYNSGLPHPILYSGSFKVRQYRQETSIAKRWK